MQIFELPKDETRVWDLAVPVLQDEGITHAYLTSAIEEPSLYNEICFILQEATKGDIVNIHINTPGGIVDSAFMLANAISNSKAKVIAHLSGTVASAGTIITMACDKVVVSPHLSFMIHNYSGGMHGKGHEMKARQKFTDDHLNAAFKSFYSGFLTEDEMERVLEGTDLWMGTEEVADRWKNRVSYMKGIKNEK